MKAAPWVAALVIVFLGGWAALTVPSSPAALGAAPSWRVPAASPTGAGGQPERLPRVVHPEIVVIEKPSPVVGPDGVLLESIGIEVNHGGFLRVLRKGQRVPVMQFLPVGSDTADQKELRFHVLRGESDTAAANRSLAWVRISGLPPFEGIKTRAAMMFAVQGTTIEMAAMDPKTGEPLKFELSEPW